MACTCDRNAQKSGEPARDPELLWKYEGLGRGFGGPCISKEGIFVNAEENGYSYTLCLEPEGTLRWRSPNGKEFVGSDISVTYPGTRSAPAILDRYVYAASGMGHVSCFDSRDGEVLWAVDLIEDYEGVPGDFGYSESPVMDEQKVYCFAGGKEHNLIALDRKTGELVWSAPVKRDSFAYSTPLLLALPGKKVLAGTSRNYIYVVDRQDGTLLSSYRLENIRYGFEHCNSVIYKDGYIYFVATEEHGQGSIKLQLSQDGSVLKEVWRNPDVVNVFQGFVVKDNWLYTTMENKKLLLLDTESGRIRHSLRSVSGTITYANNALYIYGQNGTVQIFRLKDGLPVLSTEIRIREGSGQHFSFPVIADGVMYIRRGDALMAYAVE